MFDSAKNSAKELREMVTFMEKMRVEAMKDSAARNDLFGEYSIPKLMENLSALDAWLQACKPGIQWYAEHPTRWARDLLMSNNAIIFAVDTTFDLFITRMFVMDMRGNVLYDTYVKPEPAMVESDGRATGMRNEDYSHPLPSAEVEAPSLAEAWAPLRDIIKRVRDRIVSYDVSLYQSIITSHAYYIPQLQHDPEWSSLRWQTNFIKEAMLYFDDDSALENEGALEVFCQKIAYPLPSPAQQTAEVRATAQLEVIRAMAQGIGAKDLFAEEE
jgi:hypothetical protein